MTSVLRHSTLFNDGWTFVPEEVDPSSAGGINGEAVTLPHTWNAQDGTDGGNDYRRGVSSYIKHFSAADDDQERWLEFRGVNSSARVFLNGTLVGTHEGGYSTFRVDLSEVVAPQNTLVVLVDNGPNETSYPQRADFTFYGGIYRDVYLIEVPREHFALDDSGGPGVVATVHLDGSNARVMLNAQVSGGDAVHFFIHGVGEVVAPVTEGVARASVEIASVRRWHGVRDPYLYSLVATLLVDEQAVDDVALRFGCREFAVDPDRGFVLNGEDYPLRGVSRHQDWDGVGNAITAEHMDADLELLRELGATTVRLAHYQHDQGFYDRCDEAGIVVWAEIPQISDFLPLGKADAERQLTELIVQNRHHASIMCWGLSNEITITRNTPEILTAHQELNELAHRLDPTRLTAIANVFVLDASDPLATVTDVMSYNIYYGWYVGDFSDNEKWLDEFRVEHPGVAVGISEYGADANPRFQTANPVRGDYSEQFQAAYHEHMLTIIAERPWLWATHVWNLADFGVDGRNEGEFPGRNQKGLVSFDRSLKKDAFYLYKAAWSAQPFVHIAGRRYEDRAEEVTQVAVYSNSDEVSLWCDGQLVGQQSGTRVFRFSVPLSGDHELVARAGDTTDSIRIRRVATPNEQYSMEVAEVTNWFEEDELPAPDGFYSVRDTLGDIKQSPGGAALIEQLMSRMAGGASHVAENMMTTEVAQYVLSRMTFQAVLQQAPGSVSREQVSALNAALNQISRV